MKSNIDTLESMCELIVDCPHSTPKWTDTGLIVLRNQNIRNGRLDLSGPSYTDEDNFQKRIKRAKPQAGDIVFTREAPMGEVCMIPDGVRCCLGQRQVLLRPKKSVNGKYLFFALQSPVVQHEISWNEGTGSTVSNVRIPVLKNLNIPRHPGCEDQIAEILSSLTDKIELNRQINQTLEHITQAIFKSWFVDFEPVKAKVIAWEKGGNELAQSLAAQAILCGALTLPQLQDMDAGYRGLEHKLHPLITERFPDQHGLDFWTPETLDYLAALFPDELEDDAQGCASAARGRTPGAASELGAIPKGWKWSTIGEEVDVVGGGTPSTKNNEFWEGGDINWTSPKDLSGLQDKILLKTEKKITEAGLGKISSGLLPVDTVLMSSRAPVGYLAQAKIPVAINQGYIAMKCNKRLPPEYILLWADSVMDEIKQRASGSTFAEISKKNFKPISVIVPDEEMLSEFIKQAKNIYDKITTFVFESETLSEIRDSLLPKLLSGEIVINNKQNKEVA